MCCVLQIQKHTYRTMTRFRRSRMLVEKEKLRKSPRILYLVVLAVDQSQFELELGAIDAENPRSALAVQTVDAVTLDARDVDGQVQRADDAVVTESIHTGT